MANLRTFPSFMLFPPLFRLRALVSHEHAGSHPIMYSPSLPHTTTSIYALLGFLALLSEFLFRKELSTLYSCRTDYILSRALISIA
jgi:hypothetical protein